MSAELVGIIATTLFGSAGLAALFTSAAPLTRPARLRHRIEKDAALAKTFPEGSESRRALEWSCADAAHQLAAAQLHPTPYRYRYFPLAYGLLGLVTAGMGVLNFRNEPDFMEPLSPDWGLGLVLALAVFYVVIAFALYRRTVGRWRLYALLRVERDLWKKTEPSGWTPRRYPDWQADLRLLAKEFNTRANGTPEGTSAATMATTEEGAT
jgi:hypothetical protein